MTTTFQISDKRGDAILVVKAEYDVPEQAESAFAAAVGLAGLGTAYEQFGQAVATIPAITQLTRPQVTDPWGQPPVPPMASQPYQQAAAAPAAPAGAPGPAPMCQHGTKLYKTGTSPKNGREWSAWFCPAPGNDPTQCEKQWLR